MSCNQTLPGALPGALPGPLHSTSRFVGIHHQIRSLVDQDVSRLPYAELFWASPECPQWLEASGKAGAPARDGSGLLGPRLVLL